MLTLGTYTKEEYLNFHYKALRDDNRSVICPNCKRVYIYRRINSFLHKLEDPSTEPMYKILQCYCQYRIPLFGMKIELLAVAVS